MKENIYRKRIVIVGASGYVGTYLYNMCLEQDRFEVIGTTNKTISQEWITVDLLSKEGADSILALCPDVIIWCAMNQEQEMELTEIGLQSIVKGLSPHVRFIYLSTTVGVGKQQTEEISIQYREKEAYLSQYVNGKILGESYVKSHSNHLIVRPGSIYGYCWNRQRDSRMDNLYRKFMAEETYFRTTNHYASFVHIEDLCQGIIELIDHEYTGVVNIAGSQPVSHYNFNQHLAKLMQLDTLREYIVADYHAESVYNTLSSVLRESILKTIFREI